MNIKQLDVKVHVASQIDPEDVSKIDALGFKGIICNRPDGEVDDQPDYDDIADVAESYGLSIAYIPYLNGALTAKLLQKLTDAIDATDGPVLMYCRSARRSTILWNAVRGPQKLVAE